MPVIIDTDPAIGVPFKDVDDGLAIFLAIANTEVLGLTINFGNVDANRGVEVAKEIIKVANKADIPIFKGASSEKDLGKETKASEFITDKVRENPGEVSLLAIAPLTNVATALLHYEELLEDLKELVVMGGSLNFKPMNYFGEFNFRSNPKAAEVVLRNDTQKTVVTMDVCSQVAITSQELDKLRSFNNKVSTYIAENSSLWLKINKLLTFEGFYPWDVVACANLLDKSIFETEKCEFEIQTEGLRKGRIEKKKGEKILLPTKIDSDKFLELFLSSIRKFGD